MFKFKKDSVLKTPSREEVEKTEKFYRIKFPENYKLFLEKYNGAIPVNGQFNCYGHAYFIERFLCLLDDEVFDRLTDINWSEIRVVTSEIEERLTDNPDLLGMNVIPIAVLFAGDYVCLDFRKDANHPSVCVWSHEESPDFAPTTYFVANSFEEFLGMLY